MQEEVRQRKGEHNTDRNDGREADELDSVEQPVSTPGASPFSISPCREGKEKDVDHHESHLWFCHLLCLHLYYLFGSLSDTKPCYIHPSRIHILPYYLVWVVLRVA